MRLRLFDHLETQLGLRTHGRNRLPRMSVRKAPYDHTQEMSLSREAKVAVDFRISMGARHVVPDNPKGIAKGRHNVCKSFAREIVGDLREELIELWDWTCEEGIGSDMEKKLERLIRLVEGEEVDVPERARKYV